MSYNYRIMAYLLKTGPEGSSAKRQERKSKSGRSVFTPGNLLTSVDNAPKSKKDSTVNAELEKLRTIMEKKYPIPGPSQSSQEKKDLQSFRQIIKYSRNLMI